MLLILQMTTSHLPVSPLALGDILDLFRSLREFIGVSFAEKCYQLLLPVPKGRVTTYKDLAEAMGTRAYRAVGQAMNRNPRLIEVPCRARLSRWGVEILTPDCSNSSPRNPDHLPE